MNDKVQGMDDMIQEMKEENKQLTATVAQQNMDIRELTHVVAEQAATIDDLSKVSGKT